MKKLNLSVLSLLLCGVIYAQPKTESISVVKPIPEKKIEMRGMVLLTHNAFAPLPAFSFDNPAIMTFLSIGWNRIKYEPEFSIGFNGQPWMWDNWLRYSLIQKSGLTIVAGLNPNLYFLSTKTENDKTVIEAHCSVRGEVAAIFQDYQSNKYRFTYRYNNAFDFGTISGHTIDFAVEFKRILGFSEFDISLQPQLFYFNAEGNSDGFYIGNILQLSHRKSSFLLAYQSVQSIWTGFLEKPEYNHSLSLIYLF